MKLPTIFVNHGGGPLPLLGKQPDIVQHMKDILTHHLSPTNERPKSIIVISAHWETSLPIQITSSPHPTMYYDYNGFPAETYQYKYNAPGSPKLASKVQHLLQNNGIDCELNETRGYDHGVFVPLMIMYPEANIPIVCISMHSSLDVELNMKIGSSLAPLREDENEQVLIVGSGYTFHNLNAFFNPTKETICASVEFNTWLKETLLSYNKNDNKEDDEKEGSIMEKLKKWKLAPGANLCHPREEHLMPLFIVAAAAGIDCEDRTTTATKTTVKLIYNTTTTVKEKDSDASRSFLSDHALTGYSFW
mmetsp:Transcript_4673/g.6144  ORF Transcript_4673/g.6144 Transcript_4673/m.6144 type:complete len:305 (+) Transcript_4673:113-1027(+)